MSRSCRSTICARILAYGGDTRARLGALRTAGVARSWRGTGRPTAGAPFSAAANFRQRRYIAVVLRQERAHGSHRFGRLSEAAQQVASLHTRSHGSCSRIGSVCRVVAAPFQAQAWGGAVGRVRNASPISKSLPLPNCGVRLCNSRSFDYLVFLLQTKSAAEGADLVAFSSNSLLARCPHHFRDSLRRRILV